MKLSEITKFINRVQQHNPNWQYDQIQIELLQDINRDVDGFHLANIILKKYGDNKKKPSVDQVQKVINTMKAQTDSDNKKGCDKCRDGFINVFNHKLWSYDKDLHEYISIHDWNPNKLESIFMLPVMDISCTCSNKRGLVNISSYLQWLENFNFKAQEFFEVCYIQLYIFYSQALEGSLSFDDFDPWSFWGVKPDSDMTFKIDNIINQKLKDMLLNIKKGGTGTMPRAAIRTIFRSLRKIEKSDEELL